MTPEQLAELEALEAELAAATQAAPPRDSTGRNLARSAGQGLTFGFLDEIVAGGIAGLEKLRGSDRPFMDIYRDVHEMENAGLDEFREESPWLAGGAEAGGALLTAPVAAVRAAQLGSRVAPQIAARAPRWTAPVGAGAIEGSVYGAGASDPGERLSGAATGAAAGATVAGGMGVVGAMAKRPLGWLWKQLTAADSTDAQRAVMRALEEQGMTARDVERGLRELGPDAVLADLGGNVQNLGAFAANSSRGAGPRLAEELTKRHRNQATELVATLQRHTGMPVGRGTGRRVQEQIAASARKLAEPLYSGLSGRPVGVSRRVKELLSDPLMRGIFRQAANDSRFDRILTGRGRPFKLTQDKFREGKATLVFEDIDQIQRSLRTRAEDAARKKPSIARRMREARRAILEDVDPQFPEWAEARSMWSGRKSLERAIETGKRFGKLTDEEFDTFMDDVTPMETQAFVVGFHDYIKSRIGNIRRGRDLSVAIRELDTPEFAHRLTSLLGKRRADSVLKDVENMRRKAVTFAKANRQSATAPREGIRRELANSEGSEYLGDAMRGDVLSLGGRLLRDSFGDSNPSPGTVDELARILLQQGGEAGLNLNKLPGTVGRGLPRVGIPAAGVGGSMGLYYGMGGG